jgi:succinate dehydrogenase / fumarate reductase flavoprotein subunit
MSVYQPTANIDLYSNNFDKFNFNIKIDVKKYPIKVAPTAHYTMGGISTNIDCEVIDFNENITKGLMAIGEAACVSVHGANRLGCNSLLDLIVFGEISGKNAAKNILQINFANNSKNIDEIILKFSKLFDDKADNENFSLSEMKENLQNINEKHLGVFRNEYLLETGFSKLKELLYNFKKYNLKNKSLLFNDELISYLELENLLLNSIVATYCALLRQESRGAHYRQDFELKDDENWRFHSLVKINKDGDILFKKNAPR